MPPSWGGVRAIGGTFPGANHAGVPTSSYSQKSCFSKHRRSASLGSSRRSWSAAQIGRSLKERLFPISKIFFALWGSIDGVPLR